MRSRPGPGLATLVAGRLGCPPDTSWTRFARGDFRNLSDFFSGITPRFLECGSITAALFECWAGGREHSLRQPELESFRFPVSSFKNFRKTISNHPGTSNPGTSNTGTSNRKLEADFPIKAVTQASRLWPTNWHQNHSRDCCATCLRAGERFSAVDPGFIADGAEEVAVFWWFSHSLPLVRTRRLAGAGTAGDLREILSALSVCRSLTARTIVPSRSALTCS